MSKTISINFVDYSRYSSTHDLFFIADIEKDKILSVSKVHSKEDETEFISRLMLDGQVAYNLGLTKHLDYRKDSAELLPFECYCSNEYKELKALLSNSKAAKILHGQKGDKIGHE